MFFLLSKILYFLILPFSWIFILLVFSILTRHPNWKRKSRKAAFALLIIFSNPFLANVALYNLEVRPVKIEKTYEVGVVLSGILDGGFDADSQIQTTESFDRLTEAVRLYRAGSIKKILISGGSADILYSDFNEGKLLVELAKTMGVPEDDLLLENQSKNTYENAKFTSEFMEDKQPSILLITSAFHMRRASACFKSAGMKFTPYPVDYRGRTNLTWKYMLPGSEAFENWNVVCKEMVGLLVYRMVGYI